MSDKTTPFSIEVVDLKASGVSPEGIQQFIDTMMSAIAPEILKVFVSAGLQSHIIHQMSQDNGDTYLLSFTRIPKKDTIEGA